MFLNSIQEVSRQIYIVRKNCVVKYEQIFLIFFLCAVWKVGFIKKKKTSVYMCAIDINNLSWIIITEVVEKYSMIKTEWGCVEMYTYNVSCSSL